MLKKLNIVLTKQIKYKLIIDIQYKIYKVGVTKYNFKNTNTKQKFWRMKNIHIAKFIIFWEIFELKVHL